MLICSRRSWQNEVYGPQRNKDFIGEDEKGSVLRQRLTPFRLKVCGRHQDFPYPGYESVFYGAGKRFIENSDDLRRCRCQFLCVGR